MRSSMFKSLKKPVVFGYQSLDDKYQPEKTTICFPKELTLVLIKTQSGLRFKSPATISGISCIPLTEKYVGYETERAYPPI